MNSRNRNFIWRMVKIFDRFEKARLAATTSPFGFRSLVGLRIARRSGAISVIVSGRLPRRRLLARVDGSSSWPKRSDPHLTREQLSGQATMPFEFEFASIVPLHEKAIFHQMAKASSSPNFRVADKPEVIAWWLEKTDTQFRMPAADAKRPSRTRKSVRKSNSPLMWK